MLKRTVSFLLVVALVVGFGAGAMAATPETDEDGPVGIAPTYVTNVHTNKAIASSSTALYSAKTTSDCPWWKLWISNTGSNAIIVAISYDTATSSLFRSATVSAGSQYSTYANAGSARWVYWALSGQNGNTMSGLYSFKIGTYEIEVAN